MTFPIAGYLHLSPDLQYRTEAVITNHGDKRQPVITEVIRDGHADLFRGFSIEPHQTLFLPTAGFASSSPNMANMLGAVRIRSVGDIADPDTPDTTGTIEAKAYIVAERPLSRGSSRHRAGERRPLVYPEWHSADGNTARTTPWVAYASTVDTHTGDAYSGTRVAADSFFEP